MLVFGRLFEITFTDNKNAMSYPTDRPFNDDFTHFYPLKTVLSRYAIGLFYDPPASLRQPAPDAMKFGLAKSASWGWLRLP